MYTKHLSTEETVKAQQRELEALRTELFDEEVNLFLVPFPPLAKDIHGHHIDKLGRKERDGEDGE